MPESAQQSKATKQKSVPARQVPGTCLRASGKYGPQIIQTKGKRWSQKSEEIFLNHLAASCNVTMSAAEAGFTKYAVYKQRIINPAFADRWRAALAQGYLRIEMLLVEVAEDSLAGLKIDAEKAIPAMTVKEALAVLQSYKSVVHGGQAMRSGHHKKVDNAAEARASILKKVAMVRRVRGYS